MKNDSMHGEHGNSEFFALASQLYVKLRRHTGRVVDAVYMVQNEAYAREIMHLASVQADAELNELVQRLKAFVQVETVPELPVLRNSVVKVEEKVQPVASLDAGHPPSEEHTKEEVAQHYIGALR